MGFLKELAARMGSAHVSAFAAALAYGAVFAVVPMLALVVSLLGVFNATDLVERAMGELGAVLPADITQLIDDQLTSVASTNDQATFGLGVVVATLVALWGVSGAMRRVMEALNVVHRTEETRLALRKFGTSILLASGAIVFIVATLVVVTTGGAAAERVFDVIGLGASAETAWNLLRWPALLVIAWLGITSLYRFAPAARQVGGIATPGTLIATFGWVGFSILFSIYVGTIGDMSATWGAVAGIVVFLLYMQYAATIVLLGAVIDVLIWDRSQPSSRVRRWLRRPASKA